MDDSNESPSLKEMEDSLWEQSDKVYEELHKANKQCKEYVEALKAEKEKWKQQCHNVRSQLDKLQTGKHEQQDAQSEEIQRLREKVKSQEQMIHNSKKDLAKVIENLKGPETAHTEEVLRLQARERELEEETSTSQKHLDESMKQQQEITDDLNSQRRKLRRTTSLEPKLQKQNHNKEVQSLRRDIDDLQRQLHSKNREISALKSELETARQELKAIRRQEKVEKTLANSIQVAISTMLGNTDLQDALPDICHNEEILNKIRFIFVHHVLPDHVVNVFHKYNLKILVQGDIERVICVIENHGRRFGAAVLLDRLSRYQNWYPCLLQVLRDPEVSMGHVADQMEAELRAPYPSQPPELAADPVVIPPHLRGSPEIVVAVQGANLKALKSRCKNIRDHEKFDCVENVHEEFLSVLDEDGPIGNMLKKAFDLVVKVEVIGNSQEQTSSSSRPTTPSGNSGFRRLGCGMVWDVYKRVKDSGVPCTCPKCQLSLDPKTEWAEFGVLTAMGLMKYDPQCTQTVCRLSYKDLNDRQVSSVLTAVKLKDYEKDSDRGYCELSCITHDRSFAEDLAQKVERWKISRGEAKGRAVAGEKERCIVVSYPHGLDKCASLGQFVRTDTDSMRHKRDIYNAATCDGCCGAPVFFFGNDVFTGQTVHNGKNGRGENESIEYKNSGRFG